MKTTPRVRLMIAVGAVVFSAIVMSGCMETEPPVVNFAEARMTLEEAGRRIEMVSIIQREDDGECFPDPLYRDLEHVCESFEVCKKGQYSCSKQLNDRYSRMLDKRKASTHYLHMDNTQNVNEAIALFWGLTVTESKAMCQHILNRLRKEKYEHVTLECI